MALYSIREGDGNNGTYPRTTIDADNAFDALRKASRLGFIHPTRDVKITRDIDGDDQHAHVSSYVKPIYGDACRWCAEATLIPDKVLIPSKFKVGDKVALVVGDESTSIGEVVEVVAGLSYRYRVSWHFSEVGTELYSDWNLRDVAKATSTDTAALVSVLKNRGMQDGELSLETAKEATREITVAFELSQVEAAYARASAYCYGEYVANLHETPGSDKARTATYSALFHWSRGLMQQWKTWAQ